MLKSTQRVGQFSTHLVGQFWTRIDTAKEGNKK